MTKLTYAKRENLSKGEFVFPETRRYPIEDAATPAMPWPVQVEARARRSGDGSTAKVSGDRHREVEGPGTGARVVVVGWFRPWMIPGRDGNWVRNEVALGPPQARPCRRGLR